MMEPTPLPAKPNRWWPSATLGIFAIALMHRFTLQGKVMYWGDILLYFQPMYDLIGKGLQNGRFVLWNDYILFGQPMLGNPQAPLFYPATMLLRFIPVWLFLTVTAILHIVVGGVGAYHLFKRLSKSQLGALTGAFAFCGGGYMMARLQFPTMAAAACWLPWLVMAVEDTLEHNAAMPIARIAGFTALTLLAGHPQMAYLNLAIGVTWGCARLLQSQKQGMRAGVVRCSAGLMLGATLSLGQLLPMLQLFTQSARGEMTWMQANRFVLLPQHLITLVLPNYFGHPNSADYWGAGNLWEPCIYVGIPPLILSLAGVWGARARRATLFLVAMLVVGFLLAFGRFGGLFYVAYYLVPGIKAFHDPARFAFVGLFALAALSAIGMHQLEIRRPEWKRLLWWLPALTAVNLIWYCGRLTPAAPPSAARLTPAADIENLNRVYTFDRDDMWKRFLTYSDYGPPGLRYPKVLVDNLAPNVGMGFSVREAGGYEPVPIRAATELEGIVRIALERKSPHAASLLRMMNVGTVLMPPGTRYRHPDLEPLKGTTQSWFKVHSSRHALFVHDIVSVNTPRQAMSVLSDPAFNPLTTAVVTEGVPFWKNPIENDNHIHTSELSLITTRPYFSYGVKTAEEGLLVLPQTLYPGWEAELDRVSVPVLRANHAFIGVRIPVGNHTVSVEYKPEIVRVGIFGSLIGSMLLAVLFSVGLRQKFVSSPQGAEVAGS